VKKELADFSMIMRLSPVIMHATGQRCSKLNTNPSVIISLIDEYIGECIESALEDERQASPTPSPL
jgi:hypothetical protein